MATEPKKIIIDTDPGIDDAMAIFVALRSPEIEVIGLTTIYGNVYTTLATRNALHLLEVAERTDIPVAEGSHVTLTQQYMTLSQNIHHPPHPIYGYDYDYGGAMQEQVYSTQMQQQHSNANAPSQYQSMTPAVAGAAISDVSKQFPIDNIQKPNKNSQQI
ncbi:putative uridine nucleosidase 2-like protein [Trifolium pratense]|uniref:Putative uridine nucleosidase 2-like protein n=1 Tax=Trifolium pratense TaxID=57577 RepID=A0A2K3M297_TRIPR|nr:putative uridine nucleosidase 2-like protein [Trifolium pratense]